VVARALDARAAEPYPSAGEDRLAAWASALRRADSRSEPLEDAAIRLLVPYHTVVAWRQQARSLSCSVAGWAREVLLSGPRGRHLWEAAAAERGQTMPEWCGHAALDAVCRR
jgi:hypothetical protein